MKKKREPQKKKVSGMKDSSHFGSWSQDCNWFLPSFSSTIHPLLV